MRESPPGQEVTSPGAGVGIAGHPGVVEPFSLVATLAAATPLFVSARSVFAVPSPWGRSVFLLLDPVAILSGLVAVSLGGFSLVLLRGTRPEGRAKVVAAALVALAGGVHALGKGLGLY